ncbi:phytase [Schizopora paradoxa]|uniref:Phytase A n=1 Tax=Schizopora paradoxa TaxID=27342 RepID=A0A0H2QZT9_9AGAM|nr:phytase [Schizopora paradoxa]
MYAGFFALLLFGSFFDSPKATFAASVTFKPTTPSLGVPENIQHLWANFAPYFAAAEYPAPPPGCVINQVERHGARFPTASNGAQIQSTVQKLQAVRDFKVPRLEFLRNFTYDLGHDDLVPFGAAQSFDAGQLHFVRYSELISPNKLPFVRSTSAQRVVDSATNWTAGFSFASQNRFTPVLSVVLSESANDTLDDSSCPDAGSGDEQTNVWQAIYTAPLHAFFEQAAPGANLTDTDISNLIALCPFETVAKEKPSQFCDLFNQTTFEGFEYFEDLGKFYGNGYGQELGPVQGVGYVNELIARLTNSPVQDATQTNRTLDSSPQTFPLDRTIYADFSHDNQMISIYSAMGLFRPAQPLSTTTPDPRRTWLASKLVPFSAKLVTERLECDRKQFVRILVDDSLQPLELCGGDKNGLCELDAFVQSQGFARSNGGGLFQRCFA